MRIKLSAVISVLAVVLLCFSMANAQGVSIGLKAGTLGAGIEVGGAFTDTLGARLGVNYFTYSDSGTKVDIEYDFDVSLQSVSLLLDWHPSRGSFRISGGALYNGNKVESVAKTSATYKIGDIIYTAADVGTLDGEIDFNELAPYLGLGWDTSFGKSGRFGFVFDLGAIYQGSANVKLSADGALSNDPTFLSELKKEEKNLQDELDNYKFYPVIAVGISYRF